ncbi:MAG: hypothetical protein ABI818_00095 [Acidobacteriota bacterium]
MLYRLFLSDGTTLVSYGEFARVAGQVVFSMPLGDADSPTADATGAPAAPRLLLVSIPDRSVDWDRTDKYSNAVRARRYGNTRGADDFAMLSGRVTEALNDIALTADPVRRLAMAREARANLARWPSENFGYRADEVGQLVSMLDEVIAELRIAAGQSSFDVSLVATATPEPPVDLLPDPDFRESIEQALAASAITPEPAERVSLLRAITSALQGPALDGGWAADLRAGALADLETERRVDQSYVSLASSTMAAAARRARRGDVAAVQRTLIDVLKADDRLGRRRPRETSALLAFLDLRLDEARRLRLARDASVLRREAFKDYRAAMLAPLQELRRARVPLEQIRELAGPRPKLLSPFAQRLAMARRQLASIDVPVELTATHGLFDAAFLMARRAASTRQNAVSSKDMKLAWDAASAAAGALMLTDRAAQELDRLTTPSHR